MDPSDSPDGPVCPSRATGWLTPPPPGVSRVASDPLHADMPSPLPRWDHSWDRVAPRGAVTAAFPTHLLGRLPHHCFRGLLGVHSRYGLPARGVPWGPFASKASAVSLPPLLLRLLPAGATVAGWDSDPLRISAFARRTDAYHFFVSPPAHPLCDGSSSGLRAGTGAPHSDSHQRTDRSYLRRASRSRAAFASRVNRAPGAPSAIVASRESASLLLACSRSSTHRMPRNCS